jgi:hypothetical protein
MNFIPVSCMIPYSGYHGAIVIGKGRSTINQLMTETGCFIQEKQPEIEYGRPTAYFYVEAPHEKALNQATIRIQRLLINSMMRNDKKLKSETEALGQENQHLQLIIANLELETQSATPTNYSDIKKDETCQHCLYSDTSSKECPICGTPPLDYDSESDNDSDTGLEDDIININLNA